MVLGAEKSGRIIQEVILLEGAALLERICWYSSSVGSLLYKSCKIVLLE